MVIKVEFQEETEKKFREIAMRKYGYTKGAITKAAEEAVSDWIEAQGAKLPNMRDPVGLVEGMLSHLRGRYTAVELQHEARKLWTK